MGPIALPKISDVNSPKFKGVLDISVVSQKLRRDIYTQGNPTRSIKGRHNSVNPRAATQSMACRDKDAIKTDNLMANEGWSEANEMVTFAKPKEKKSMRMNPRVLETWLNETLQDAEHLDIPGCILKSDKQNPMARYGIDCITFENAGLAPDVQERLYRALFVYSVGFYEMINKSLTHIKDKFSIVTAIWKVYTILLEYCCRTDYRMLISEISKKND